MKAYKGFDKDLKCRGYQYEVGGEYEEKEAELCNCGFHACEAPLDTFSYYPPADSRYCAVELDDVTDEKSSDDTKRVGKKIKIGAEIGLPGLASAHVKWVKEQVDWKNAKETNTGNWSAATNTGGQSAATNTGNRSAAEVGGKGSVAIATGFESRVKGALGCAIVCVERGKWDGNTYLLLSALAGIVDGNELLPDTWYTVKGGKWVEC